jgi:hypothetical protein
MGLDVHLQVARDIHAVFNHGVLWQIGGDRCFAEVPAAIFVIRRDVHGVATDRWQFGSAYQEGLTT